VVLTHTFSATAEQVFRAYTDPEQIPTWWGPRELKTTVNELDLRPGGRWRFVQHDAEGHEYAFHGVFHEVATNRRLIRTFEFEGAPGHVLLEAVTFEVVDGGTRLTTHSVFQSVADRDEMVSAGMERGATESMQRLSEVLRAD
jgi:uncharacterized protein YndB with AHSA1/START domain